MNPARKAWLKKLASHSHGAWMTAVRPPALDGTTRLETRRTVYVFEDGMLVEVARRDGATSSAFLGARLMGWLVEEEEVSNTWRPNARAILWRAGASDDGQSLVALTSPGFAFIRVLSETSEGEAASSESVDDEAPAASHRRMIA